MKAMKKKSRNRYSAPKQAAQMSNLLTSFNPSGGCSGALGRSLVLMAAPRQMQKPGRSFAVVRRCLGRGVHARPPMPGLAGKPCQSKDGDDGERPDDKNQPQVLIRLGGDDQGQREENPDRDEGYLQVDA